MKPLKSIAVECGNIGLSYGTTQVLRDITLKIEPGEFFALLGPSGSGKSTLLRLIAGFNQHQRGQLLIDGRDVTGTPPWARDVGVVFQSYALWPHMNVRDNVSFGLVERRYPRDEVRRRTDSALDLVGLLPFADRRPNQLSGGQQQRVALARTVVIEPKVLLLDEPLSNLDKNLRVQMRQELKKLQRDLGITTIFVTHDQEEAMTTADRMAVLDHGVLQQIGSPAALFDYPANRFVANFVGTSNFLEGQVVGSDGCLMHFLSPRLGELAIPLSGTDWPERVAGSLAFRPHTVRVLPADDRVSSDEMLWLDGRIVESEFLGEFVRYRVDVAGVDVIADQSHYAGLPFLKAGVDVKLGVIAAQLRFVTH